MEQPKAQVDYIYQGKAGGNIAARLIQSGMNVNALRTNDLLLYDEWKLIDRVVIQAAQERLICVSDLMTRGLVYDIPNGLSKSVLAWQDASDIEAAQVSMDGVTRGRADRPKFNISYLPLPIIHCDFFFSIREIQESRNGNMPLDTTMASLAGRQVAEKVEAMLITGSSSYTFGGGTIYGYLDAPNRNTVTLTEAWDAAGKTGEEILADVLAMKQASINALHYGPWVLYIPTAYETQLDEEFKTNSDKSIRQRLLEVGGIQDIKVADKLTANNVLLVQMSSDVVRMVQGMAVTPLQWETDGGMMVNFKVMTILVPNVRNDQNLKSGIVHLS